MKRRKREEGKVVFTLMCMGEAFRLVRKGTEKGMILSGQESERDNMK